MTFLITMSTYHFTYIRILKRTALKSRILITRLLFYQRIAIKIVAKNFCHVRISNYFCNLFVIVHSFDVADSARVIIPQLDGNSYYINFCYIDVSVKLSS